MDYSDSNRNHFSADVISGELEQARTDDVTPPTVVLTAPVSGTESSGFVSVTADATDNVGVKKVEFYRNGALMVTDTTPPFATGLDFADSYYPAGTHTFHDGRGEEVRGERGGPGAVGAVRDSGAGAAVP